MPYDASLIEVDAIPERHAMGDDRALGPACRARGVHDGRDVIERDNLGAVERRGGRDGCLIGATGAEPQRGRNAAEFCDRERDLGEVVIVDHHFRGGVADDELQLRHGQPRVQRQEYRADPETGELHFQRIGRVQRQHRDAVAARDAESVAEVRGQPRDPRVELRVGEPAFGGKVYRGDLARRAAAEMRDPVVVANGRHAFSPSCGLAPLAFSWRRSS
jgi:hypothetical protein